MVRQRVLDRTMLKVGDVVSISLKTRKGVWFKRFAVVIEVGETDNTTLWPSMVSDIVARALELDMSNPRDLSIYLDQTPTYLVPNEEWPEGVSAMYMKATIKGWLPAT